MHTGSPITTPRDGTTSGPHRSDDGNRSLSKDFEQKRGEELLYVQIHFTIRT